LLKLQSPLFNDGFKPIVGNGEIGVSSFASLSFKERENCELFVQRKILSWAIARLTRDKIFNL